MTATYPPWISVTDRMPPNGKAVLLKCHPCAPMKARVLRGMWVSRYWLEAGADDEGEATEYNEADDEYYTRGGWYELIDNWGDYTHVMISSQVTHWMELPPT